ncbi:DUF3592 domain-containing protein [Actinopolymorpha singaporensis]
MGILAGLLGATALALIAITLAYDSHVLATRGQVADAVVLDKILPKTSKEAARITVRFTTKDGRQVEDWTESFVDHDPSVHEGDTIRVLYDPDDPAIFQDARWGNDYTGSAVFGAGAIGLAGYSLWELRPARTARHRTKRRPSHRTHTPRHG